jgi:hypothetical protein
MNVPNAVTAIPPFAHDLPAIRGRQPMRNQGRMLRDRRQIFVADLHRIHRLRYVAIAVRWRSLRRVTSGNAGCVSMETLVACRQQQDAIFHLCRR